MHKTDGAVDDDHLRIGGFLEGKNHGHMILVWFAFNELHWITSDGDIYYLGDNFRVASSTIVNVSDVLG